MPPEKQVQTTNHPYHSDLSYVVRVRDLYGSYDCPMASRFWQDGVTEPEMYASWGWDHRPGQA